MSYDTRLLTRVYNDLWGEAGLDFELHELVTAIGTRIRGKDEDA
jgi:hypothetical protein